MPTGRLVFEIRTYLPAGLKCQWLETDTQPLEGRLPDIVAVFVAAGPLLARQRQKREAAERERQLTDRRRYEEQQRRKRDANRWRQFREIAQDWRDLAAARDFLSALRSMDGDRLRSTVAVSASGSCGPRTGSNVQILPRVVSKTCSGGSLR